MRIVAHLISLIFIIGCILVGSGCSSASEKKFMCKEYAKEFFRLNTRERVLQFNKLDINTQYCIYLYGNQAVHPPAIYLTTEFAKQPSVLPFIVTKLQQATDDLTIRDLVYVFSELQRMKLYSIANDKNIMDLLTHKANEIKNDQWRSLTLQTIKDLK